jgi:hypothetical protein
MTKSKAVTTVSDLRDQMRGGLDARYGEIGISAVVAALRYQTSPTPKNPAYAEDLTFGTVQNRAA